MESLSPAGAPEPSVSFEMVPEGVIDFHLSLPRPLSGSLQEQSAPWRAQNTLAFTAQLGTVLVPEKWKATLKLSPVSQFSAESGSGPRGQCAKEKNSHHHAVVEVVRTKHIHRHLNALLLNLKQH